MLLKVLFLLLIAYLALRAITNLFRAIWHEPGNPAPLRDVPPTNVRSGFRAPASRTERRPFDGEVEDARFVDLEEPQRS